MIHVRAIGEVLSGTALNPTGKGRSLGPPPDGLNVCLAAEVMSDASGVYNIRGNI